MRTNDYILDWGSQRDPFDFVDIFSLLTGEQGKRVDLDPDQLMWEDKDKELPMYSYIDNNSYVTEKLQAAGYDGIIASEGLYDDLDDTIYIAFNSNQVKGQFNPKPTKGPKIMFQTRKNPKIEKIF